MKKIRKTHHNDVKVLLPVAVRCLEKVLKKPFLPFIMDQIELRMYMCRYTMFDLNKLVGQ